MAATGQARASDAVAGSPASAAEAITPRTRATIIQHTFGIPAETEPLLELATMNDVYVIEDAALALGSAEPKGLLGTIDSPFGRGRASS